MDVILFLKRIFARLEAGTRYSRTHRLTLQMPCVEKSKQIFPEMKLLVPNFHIHVSVSDLYIPTIGPRRQYIKIGRPIVGMYKSLTNT
jgi:hypothetical protein